MSTLRIQLQTQDGDMHERQMSGVPRVDDDVNIGGEVRVVVGVEWQADSFRNGGPDVVVALT